MNQYTFSFLSLEEIQKLAGYLAKKAQPRDIITLQGDLGAGKTSFARAFIAAANPNIIEVLSPTFTYVQWYESPLYEIAHFDLYRMNHPHEAFELGLEDAFAQAVSLIEWPERINLIDLPGLLKINIILPENLAHRHIILQGSDLWNDRFDKELMLSKNFFSDL